MRNPRTLRSIAEVARTAQHPERLHHLITLIEDGLGYALYQSVSTAKAELSKADTTVLRFHHKAFTVERPIARSEFEDWIAPDLRRLANTVDEVLIDASLSPDAIDRVFLTGGTAFVPGVRRLFEDRFGADKADGWWRIRFGRRGPRTHRRGLIAIISSQSAREPSARSVCSVPHHPGRHSHERDDRFTARRRPPAAA